MSAKVSAYVPCAPSWEAVLVLFHQAQLTSFAIAPSASYLCLPVRGAFLVPSLRAQSFRDGVDQSWGPRMLSFCVVSSWRRLRVTTFLCRLRRRGEYTLSLALLSRLVLPYQACVQFQ